MEPVEVEDVVMDPALDTDLPKRPPPIKVRPPHCTLPLRREARADGLFELIYEYVSRKFIVLADLTERAFFHAPRVDVYNCVD